MVYDLMAGLKSPKRLAALHALDLLDTPSEAVFDRLARLAARMLQTPVALVSLIDDKRQFFKSCIGLPDPLATWRQTPVSHSFCQHVVASGEALVVNDAREHPVLKSNPAVEGLGVIAYLGIPLRTSDGQVLGSFCVVDSSPRDWTDDQIDIMSALAESVMSEIELRRHRTSLEKLVEERTAALLKANRDLKEEVAERGRAQERQQLMVKELDHRVKNNMSAVLAIVDQTISGCASLEEFAASFRGRMMAMKRVHAMLAQSHWSGADLGTLIRQTMDPFSQGRQDRIVFTGEPILLHARAVSSVCMAMHELATNAAKYGALSVPEGRIDIRWFRETGPDHAEQLHITWFESGGPPVAPPKRRGFGSELIESGIPHDLHGRSRLEFNPAGVRCELILPLEGAPEAK